MQTKLPIITQQECIGYFHGPMLNNKICTFDTSRRRAACTGDNGGPLVYEGRLLGILLFTGWQLWIQPDVFFNFNNPDTHNLVNFHINIVRGVH